MYFTPQLNMLLNKGNTIFVMHSIGAARHEPLQDDIQQLPWSAPSSKYRCWTSQQQGCMPCSNAQAQ